MNLPEQLGMVHTIASRGLLGKYKLFPDGFVAKRTSVEFEDMFPFD